MKSANGDLEKYLVSHSIKPTPQRVQVLKIIISIPNREFSFGDIYQLIQKEERSASTSSVVNTLKLFKNTGLIKESVNKSSTPQLEPKKGRPQTKYIYHQTK